MSNLIVVPEFPQSKSDFGCLNSPPVTKRCFGDISIFMPQSIKHEIVELTSFPFDMFVIFELWFERAANIIDLCDIDLSPGNVIVPLIGIIL